jgi:hypothetical protein
MTAARAHPHLTTFHVSDVKPNQVKKYFNIKNLKIEHIAMQLDIYKQAKCEKILQGTPFPKENMISSENGFVYAATRAYNGHHHLVLRPDDIWLSIMTQFSFYINARAEEFRDKFVSFEGKKGVERERCW